MIFFGGGEYVGILFHLWMAHSSKPHSVGEGKPQGFVGTTVKILHDDPIYNAAVGNIRDFKTRRGLMSSAKMDA